MPVGLIGTEDIQPVGARFPRLAKVTRQFGTPMGRRGYAGVPAGKARRLLTDESWTAIAELTGQERADGYNEIPGAGSAARTVTLSVRSGLSRTTCNATPSHLA